MTWIEHVAIWPFIVGIVASICMMYEGLDIEKGKWSFIGVGTMFLSFAWLMLWLFWAYTG